MLTRYCDNGLQWFRTDRVIPTFVYITQNFADDYKKAYMEILIKLPCDENRAHSITNL